jgi:hypothetical protein
MFDGLEGPDELIELVANLGVLGMPLALALVENPYPSPPFSRVKNW